MPRTIILLSSTRLNFDKLQFKDLIVVISTLTNIPNKLSFMSPENANKILDT